MFDLEKFKDLPITYRIADGNVEMSIGDPGRTIAFAPMPSGKELGWNWDSTGTLEDRARGLISARVYSLVNKAMHEQETSPKPACNDRQSAGAINQAQVDITKCARGSE